MEKRLYDISLLSEMPASKAKITLVTPTNDFKNFKMNNNSLLSVSGHLSVSRDIIMKLKLGADFYLDIDDKEIELHNKFSLFATEFKEGIAGFDITKKNYFILRKPSTYDIEDLTSKEQEILKKLIYDSKLVRTSTNPYYIGLLDSDDVYESPDDGYLLSAYDVMNLLSEDKSNIMFADYIEIYNQKGEEISLIEDDKGINDGEIKLSRLDKALDFPKLYAPKKAKEAKIEAPKIHLYYEYDASVSKGLLPKCIIDSMKGVNSAPVVEFTFDHFTDDGKLVWFKSDKIVQNHHNEAYENSLREIGNRSFIELDKAPNLNEVISELGSTGLLQEFIATDSSNKYFIANQYFISKDEYKCEEKVLDIAANWWLNNVKNPVYDNGYYSEEEAKTYSMLVSPLTNEQIDTFKSTFKELLKESMSKYQDGVIISLDRHAHGILKKALDAAGIVQEPSWNVSMSIQNDIVKVNTFMGEEIIFDINKEYEKSKNSSLASK